MTGGGSVGDVLQGIGVSIFGVTIEGVKRDKGWGV